MNPLSGIGGLLTGKSATATAGTTQTQAGATAWPTTGDVSIQQVTTGNASDGIALPRGNFPNSFGSGFIVENLSANALKVYGYYTSATTNDDGDAYGATVNGGSANAAFTQAASSTYLYVLKDKNNWRAIKLS